MTMTTDLLNDSSVMWRPRDVESTQMLRFRDHVNSAHAIDLKSYHELHTWSIENHVLFWEDFWSFAGIVFSENYSEVLDVSKSMHEIPRWFTGSKLNYAENIFARGDPGRVAIYATGEGSTTVQQVTFAELRTLVARLAAAMRRMGVASGDRIVGYLPNCVEAVAAMLATSSIGAIWSSTSPDFGVSGVLDRFSQIEPKLLFSVNAVRYNGKVHDHIEKLEKVASGLPQLEKVVVLNFVTCGDGLNGKPDIRHVRNSCHYEDFCALPEGSSEPVLAFEQLPFDHPLYIMYSSGTTGVPKCMVHSQGGTLIKHLEEHMLQGNVSSNDIMLYYTTTGWMMWNWMVSVLAVGAAVVLYDGSPLVPRATVLWDLVDQLGITILGTGAKWISVIESQGIKPISTHRLTSLHTILSTGSPLKPQSFDYVYEHVKPDVLLASITGGTDIIGVFAGVNPCLPVHRGEIQSAHLGMAIESWDEDGKRILGERGELVCTKPFPSMPVYFWNDESGQKYYKSYFARFPGVWAHGDFCLVNPDTKGIWMLGRSDGTLNPNGVRFGSAEIYHVVESFKEVVDSVCVAQRNRDNTEERVILFLKMASEGLFNDDLLRRLRASIRTLLSARHVPEVILETKDIPYTISGKKVEVAVRDTICGQPVLNTSALANPAALNLFKDVPALQGY